MSPPGPETCTRERLDEVRVRTLLLKRTGLASGRISGKGKARGVRQSLRGWCGRILWSVGDAGSEIGSGTEEISRDTDSLAALGMKIESSNLAEGGTSCTRTRRRNQSELVN
jgi:hypothetical protein